MRTRQFGKISLKKPRALKLKTQYQEIVMASFSCDISGHSFVILAVLCLATTFQTGE